MEIPLIIRVDIPFTTFNPDAPDTHIYCVNETQQSFHITTNSTSFTTIDEESGESVSHGSSPFEKIIHPGDVVQIANVLGWEWDGFVGIAVCFKNLSDNRQINCSYNLKSGVGDYFDVKSELAGRIVPPI